jgi:hypothetical protein
MFSCSKYAYIKLLKQYNKISIFLVPSTRPWAVGQNYSHFHFVATMWEVLGSLSSAEAIGIGLHESYMKFRLGSGTRAGGDGKTEERIASAS